MRNNPLKTMIRNLLLARLKKPVPHSIRPLSKIDYATVLVNSSAADAAEVCKETERYFEGKGMPVRIYSPSPEMLGFSGRIAPKHRSSTVKPFILPRCVEPQGLFISLIADADSFLSCYELRRSGACFKIACCNALAPHSDIAFSVPEGAEVSQMQLLKAIEEYLERIE